MTLNWYKLIRSTLKTEQRTIGLVQQPGFGCTQLDITLPTVQLAGQPCSLCHLHVSPFGPLLAFGKC